MGWPGRRSAGLGVGRALRASLGILCLAGASPRAQAADVVILKSVETASWRPAIEVLRREMGGRHEVLEVELKGTRSEGERVMAGLEWSRDTVVVAMGPLAAQLARESMPGLPLVLCMVQDPAGLGLLDAPNTAAVSFSAPARDQLSAIRLLTPAAVRVGVMYSSEELARPMRDARAAPDLQQVVLVPRVLSSARQVPSTLQRLLVGPDAVDVLWMPPDPMLLGPETRRHILSEALKARKPVYTFSPALVAEGALASIAPDMASIGAAAAALVDKLIAGRGARGIAQATKTEIVVNGKVAAHLGVEVPAEARLSGRKISVIAASAAAP